MSRKRDWRERGKEREGRGEGMGRERRREGSVLIVGKEGREVWGGCKLIEGKRKVEAEEGKRGEVRVNMTLTGKRKQDGSKKKEKEKNRYRKNGRSKKG